MGAAASSLGLGDKEGMDQALNKLSTDYATNPHAQKMAGPFAQFCTYLDTLRSQDEYNVETVIYKKILRDFINPKTEVLLDHIGDIYRDRFEYEKAEDLFEYVADNWQGELRAIEAQTNIVRMYISKGDEPNSTRTFDTLVKKFAGDELLPWAVVEVAEKYWDFGSTEPACQKFEYVLNNYPGYEKACGVKMKLIMVLIKRSDLETAEIKLAELLTDFAGSDQLAPAVHEIIEEYQNSGAHEQGRELFTYILENWNQNDETNLELQVGVALQSIKLNDEENTKSAIDRLIADYNDPPNIAKALFQIAEEYFYAVKYRESSALWEVVEKDYQAIEFPYKGETPYVIGTCYERIREYDKAIAYYKKGLVQYPENKFACRAAYRIGLIYEIGTKEYEKAPQWYIKAREEYTDRTYSYRSLWRLGTVYLKYLKDYEKAAECFEQFTQEYPSVPRVWGGYYKLAEAYEGFGDNEKAIEVLQKIIDETPRQSRRAKAIKKKSQIEKGGAK